MTRLRMVALALAAMVGLSGCGFQGLYGATWLPGGPSLGSHPYTVSIDFANVLDLVPSSNVKVDDVAVGKVTDVKLDYDKSLGSLAGWIAKVTVKVNGDVHLPANAHAAIKMTSLLGEKFVDLERPPAGTESSDPLKNGDKIPLSSTGTAPEVEEVLGAMSLLLNGGGLEQIQTITQELNKALKGHEQDIRDLLTQLNTFVGTLDAQKNKITDALAKIDHLAVTLNQQKQTITDALDTFPGALKILKNDRTQLVQMLKSLATLGSTSSSILTVQPNPGSGATVQGLFVDSLQKLQRPLEELTKAGDKFPKALQILLTFPFPLGKATEFLRSDYANLALHLDVSLTDNLCGVAVPALCDLVHALLPTGTGSASTKSSTTTTTTKTLMPKPVALPGVGG